MRIVLKKLIPKLGRDLQPGEPYYARKSANGNYDLFYDEEMTRLAVCDLRHPGEKKATGVQR